MKQNLDHIEDNNRVKEAFESEEFKRAFRKQIEKDTWEQGLPMIYLNDEGWIVEHWKDGRIDKKKKIR
jgi:hypothetical protein